MAFIIYQSILNPLSPLSLIVSPVWKPIPRKGKVLQEVNWRHQNCNLDVPCASYPQGLQEIVTSPTMLRNVSGSEKYKSKMSRMLTHGLPLREQQFVAWSLPQVNDWLWTIRTEPKHQTFITMLMSMLWTVFTSYAHHVYVCYKDCHVMPQNDTWCSSSHICPISA